MFYSCEILLYEKFRTFLVATRLPSLDYFVLLVKTGTKNRNRSFMAIVLEDIINFEFTTNPSKYGMHRKCA